MIRAVQEHPASLRATGSVLTHVEFLPANFKSRAHCDAGVSLAMMNADSNYAFRSFTKVLIMISTKRSLLKRSGLHALLLSIALVFISTGPLTAQARAEPSPTETLNQGMRARWYLRATTLSGASQEGLIVSIRDGTFVIGDAPVQSKELRILERRLSDQRPARRGALIGGFAALALSGLIVATYCEADCLDSRSMRFVGGYTITGAGMGALLGGLLSDSHKWRTIWRQ